MIITSIDNESTVTGSSEYGGEAVLNVKEAANTALLQEILHSLNKIEYHLSLMTDADLEKGAL